MPIANAPAIDVYSPVCFVALFRISVFWLSFVGLWRWCWWSRRWRRQRHWWRMGMVKPVSHSEQWTAVVGVLALDWIYYIYDVPVELVFTIVWFILFFILLLFCTYSFRICLYPKVNYKNILRSIRSEEDRKKRDKQMENIKNKNYYFMRDGRGSQNAFLSKGKQKVTHYLGSENVSWLSCKLCNNI